MAEEKEVYEYPGKAAAVRWNGKLCIHIGECGRAKRELFVAGRDPWCEPDRLPVEDVLEIVKRCPTGALSLAPRAGAPSELPAGENAVVVSNNGPLYLRGDLSIDGATPEMEGVRFRAALCRCGQSGNKPFCDNRHEAAKFVDRGAVGEPGDGAGEPGGRLEVARVRNGPLLLRGSFQIVAASGRVAWRGRRAALCRCGHSKNKPFCDGAHEAAGFRAD